MERKQKKEDKIISIKEDDLNKLKEHSRKLKELEEEVKKRDAEILQLKDRCLRIAAEFDNYKKRTAREKQDIFRFGTENFIMQLLPFDDIFESVVRQLENNPSSELIHKGMEMLKKEFTKLLDGIGVQKIESVGKPFNPAFHEASGTVETDRYEEGTVVEEERPGYILHSRVLRPALVKVSKKPVVQKPDNNEDSGTCKN